MTAPATSPLAARGSTAAHRLAPVLEMSAVTGGTWPLTSGQVGPGWTCRPRVATRTLGADASRIGAIREFTFATLRRWGAAERGSDIVTVASELLTNATRHALPSTGRTCSRWPILFGLLQPGHCVVCAVADPSEQVPVMCEPDDLAECGRGLQVVAALSDRWGFTTPNATGKVVWAMFSVMPQRPRQDPGRWP